MTGFDFNSERISQLKEGVDLARAVSSEDLRNSPVIFSDNPADLREAMIHIVAVPTPVEFVDVKSICRKKEFDQEGICYWQL